MLPDYYQARCQDTDDGQCPRRLGPMTGRLNAQPDD